MTTEGRIEKKGMRLRPHPLFTTEIQISGLLLILMNHHVASTIGLKTIFVVILTKGPLLPIGNHFNAV